MRVFHQQDTYHDDSITISKGGKSALGDFFNTTVSAAGSTGNLESAVKTS